MCNEWACAEPVCVLRVCSVVSVVGWRALTFCCVLRVCSVVSVVDGAVDAQRGAFGNNGIIRPRYRISGLPAAQRAVVLDRHPAEHHPATVCPAVQLHVSD